LSQESRLDSIASTIRSGKYRRQPTSKKALRTQGMISIEERKLLSFLAAQAWQRETSIIDGGSFLGASTCALIDGLQRNPVFDSEAKSIIHSYDLFTANGYMVEGYLAQAGIAEGDSYLDLFLNNIQPDQALVEVHAGNVREMPWKGGPISILFLDMIWSWDINQFVMEHFYRNLAEDGAFVVHQDYVYAWYPWLPISMEYLSDYFEYIDYVPLASVVFRCKKPLNKEAASIDLLRDVSPDRLVALMSKALDRFDGEPRGILECSKGSLLRYLGRTEEARDHLLGIIQQFCGYEAPPRFARQIISHIDSGEEARVV
jgi:hypothetical protein